MLQWLLANWQTILVASALLIVVVLIVVKMIKDKKSGKSGCGCGCEGCAMSGKCGNKENK